MKTKKILAMGIVAMLMIGVGLAGAVEEDSSKSEVIHQDEAVSPQIW
jgi:hypothetical protein